jgi:putative membrane protein
VLRFLVKELVWKERRKISMWPGHMGGEWWMWLIGGMMMLLFWGGVIALAFFAIRAITRSGRIDNEPRSTSYPRGSSLDILKERYARGEISREEYLAMRKDLEE